MDVIIVSNKGILDTPIVTTDSKAEAIFDNIAENLLGEDWEEVKNIIDYDYKFEEVNRLLLGSGKEINWFTNIEKV